MDLKKNNKKLYVIGGISVGTVLVLAGLMFGYFYWLNHYASVATINGKKITQKEYDDQKAYDKKIYTYTKNTTKLNNLSEVSKRAIIEKNVIQTEATKRNIVVSDETVNAEYKKIVAGYKDEAEYLRTNASIVGAGQDKTKENIKLRLQKEALEKQVVRYYDLGQIFYRDDYVLDTNNTADPIRTLAAKKKIDGIEAQLKAGATWTSMIAQVQNDKEFVKPFSNALPRGHVTEEESKKLMIGATEWSEIKKIKKTGEFTPVLQSAGGFDSIYYAEYVSEGTYASWDKYLDSFSANSINKTACSVNNRLVDRIIGKFIPSVYACTTMDSTHTGYLSAGATAVLDGQVADININDSTLNPVIDSEYAKYCHNLDAPWRSMGMTYAAYNGVFCGYDWNMTMSAPGYNLSYVTAQYYNTVESCRIAKRPTTGTSCVLTTAFDGYIDSSNFGLMINGGSYFIQFHFTPIPPQNLTINIQTDTGDGLGYRASNIGGSVNGPGINCGDTCTHAYNYNDVVPMTPIPNSGYVFDGWYINTVLPHDNSENPLNVRMNQEQVMTARFVVKPACTVTALPTTGYASLPVKVSGSATFANPVFSYTIDSELQTATGSSFYHTFAQSKAIPYIIKATAKSAMVAEPIPCAPAEVKVQVKERTSGNGGEVAP